MPNFDFKKIMKSKSTLLIAIMLLLYILHWVVKFVIGYFILDYTFDDFKSHLFKNHI